MPGENGKGLTSRGTRSAVSGNYVVRMTSTSAIRRTRVKDGHFKAVRLRRHRDKAVAPRDKVDKYGHMRVPAVTETIHIRRRIAPLSGTGPKTHVEFSSSPGVTRYVDLVLTALKDILSARLGAIAAADMDVESLCRLPAAWDQRELILPG